jgi:nicotinate-nucleotide adenylyltransferase
MSETPGADARARRTEISGVSRVAFFGGSFDPPHKGHLAVARAAQRALGLDAVLFAPVGAQPLKEQGARASFEDRLAMTRLAIAGEAGFVISPADAPSAAGTPNYSVETLRRVRAELDSGLGGACRLFFLMGADTLLGLRQWHRAAEVPFAAEMIVASRPGQAVDDQALADALPEGLRLARRTEGDEMRGGVRVRGFRVGNERGEIAELYLLPGVDERVSASEIRQQVSAAKNESALQEWVPEAVADYISAHALYR